MLLGIDNTLLIYFFYVDQRKRRSDKLRKQNPECIPVGYKYTKFTHYTHTFVTFAK